jgi:hypothetical protein
MSAINKLLKVARALVLGALMSSSVGAAPSPKWGIVFVACGNGTSNYCDVKQAPLPVFATPELCEQGLSAYKEAITKVFALSIRPDLVTGSLAMIECRMATWSNGGYRFKSGPPTP